MIALNRQELIMELDPSLILGVSLAKLLLITTPLKLSLPQKTKWFTLMPQEFMEKIR